MGIEIFTAINGYDEKYLISNHGRVYVKPYVSRFYSEAWDRWVERERGGKFMSRSETADGYLHVSLQAKSDRESRTAKTVHSLVIEYFGPPKPSPDHIINHIDSDKKNNHINNLEWVLPVENRLHSAVTKAKQKVGEERVTQKLQEWL